MPSYTNHNKFLSPTWGQRPGGSLKPKGLGDGPQRDTKRAKYPSLTVGALLHEDGKI